MLEAWLQSGVMVRDARAAFYPYSQSFDHNGRMYHRHGLIAAVRLSPFGQGQVVPHEKTYQGAIEDRLALMRATRVQMSPIFGLFSDRDHKIVSMLYENLGLPEMSGTLDGVKHDLWSVTDHDVQNRVIDLMGTTPIYIADGHHRYTTALAYQQEMIKENGGPLAPNHPANFCMFTLVALQDDGLLILPTHRLIGNIAWFDPNAFKSALGDKIQVQVTALNPEQLAEFAQDVLPRRPAHTMGMYDAKNKDLYILTVKDPELLAKLEPDRSAAYRHLDVSILQRFLLDEVLANFSDGRELTRGYTADARQIVPMMEDGQKYQLAFILQSTPLHALEELGRSNETMPQKSTYFYPKLATGMAINPLR
jgi:uncharacterized protein (DUF1015 family)